MTTGTELKLTDEQQKQHTTAIEDANYAVDFAVDDEASASEAEKMFKDLNDTAKEIEKERLKITTPMTAAKTAVDTFFKKASGPITKGTAHLKGQIQAFNLVKKQAAEKKEREALKEQRRLEKEAADKQDAIDEEHRKECAAAEKLAEENKAPVELPPPPEPVEPPPPMHIEEAAPAKTGGLRYRKNWGYEIMDPGAIPMEFFVLDEKALKAWAVEHQDSKPVAGVKFFNTPTPY